jgi:hypothetical protein
LRASTGGSVTLPRRASRRAARTGSRPSGNPRVTFFHEGEVQRISIGADGEKALRQHELINVTKTQPMISAIADI